jgi:hypothetical protein
MAKIARRTMKDPPVVAAHQEDRRTNLRLEQPPEERLGPASMRRPV